MRAATSPDSEAPGPTPAPEPLGAALVIGLGNPGPAYAGHRHNVGFLVLDVLAGRMGGRFGAHKARAEVLEGRLAGRRAVLAKPRTYMNLSGAAISGLTRYFGVPPERLVVVHDELDLPFESLRLKLGGGDNGHNGLRSITASLHTRDYLRVRIGIGRPPGRQDPADFVLHDFAPTERRVLPDLVEVAADAVEELLAHGLAAAQNTFHARSV